MALPRCHEHDLHVPEASITVARELQEPMTSADSSPDRAVLQAELSTEVETAVASLSPTLRGAVVLVCLQGFSSAEAAEIEDCSAATIHWRVHEGRQKLKRLLKEHLS
jgi:RNA polymerase sigma-70 factor (ECF subfamily)